MICRNRSVDEGMWKVTGLALIGVFGPGEWTMRRVRGVSDGG